MNFNPYISIPLRLIISGVCNGRCYYCHGEGFSGTGFMSVDIVTKCAEVAECLKIDSLSISGGEPTLHPDISEIVSGIQAVYNGKVCLTTNGLHLEKLRKNPKPLHKINLSLSSFDSNVYDKFQCVSPEKALNAMNAVSANNKNVNIVVTEDNYQEIEQMVNNLISNSISVDILFELNDGKSNKGIQTHILEILLRYGIPVIDFKTITPKAVIKINESCKISIKHPSLSRLQKNTICNSCELAATCFERICAVRVYPNMLISPCLNSSQFFNNGNLRARIESAYALLEDCKSPLTEMLVC